MLLNVHPSLNSWKNQNNLIVVYTCVYTFSCLLNTLSIVHNFSNKALILSGNLLLIIGLYFIPSLDLNKVIAGLIIAAIGNGPALVHSMPELLNYGKECGSEGSVE